MPSALSAVAPFALVSLGACAALLACDLRGFRPGVWLCKPLAAAAFVGAGWAAGGAASGYGRLVLLALAFSWLGDVLLIATRPPALFLAGMGSFLLAHVVFAVAFASRGLAPAPLAVCAVAAFAAGALVLRWLGPHLAGVFRFAVPAYVLVIAAMVALAGSAAQFTGDFAIAAGALMFALSDVSVARDRFVAPGFVNGAWGLPLYFGAQLVLAATVAGVADPAF